MATPSLKSGDVKSSLKNCGTPSTFFFLNLGVEVVTIYGQSGCQTLNAANDSVELDIALYKSQ